MALYGQLSFEEAQPDTNMCGALPGGRAGPAGRKRGSVRAAGVSTTWRSSP